MSFERLFKQQQHLYDSILRNIQNGETHIAIYGNSGCGKSHLSEHIIRNLCEIGPSMVLRFSGDILCIDKDYYPIISGLDSYCKKYNIIKTIKKALPKFFNYGERGAFLEYISNTIINRSTENDLYINRIFSEAELDLMYKIRSCITGRNCVIYLDNLHWWDKKTLDFFYLLMEHSNKYLPELNKAVILCNITMDQESPNNENVNNFTTKMQFKRFVFQKMTLAEYSSFLKCMGLKLADSPMISVLYNISHQHLTIAKEMLSWQSNTFVLPDNSCVSDHDFLNMMIEKRLLQLEATGVQIAEVLKYGSLIGLAFSLLELEYLVPYDDEQLKEIVSKANEISLIELQYPRYRFSHDLIRELFKKKMEENSYTYYKRTVSCFKVLHPYDYQSRIKYLLLIGSISEIETLYCLEVCKSLEDIGSYDKNYEFEVLLSNETLEYIDTMQRIYINYQKGGYNEALTLAKGIETFYPIELLSLKDQMISQILTKSLDNEQRKKAVDVLAGYKDKLEEFSEEQIWSKCMMCLLAAYIHIRDLNNAAALMSNLTEFYGEQAKICDDYKKELNILRRKSTPFYELEVADIYLQKSIKFFAPQDDNNGIVSYPVQYFMSLINYSSNQICLGKFEDAFYYTKKALDLYNNMKGIRFPRIEIAINNYLISSFFSQNMKAVEIIESFLLLLEKLENIADRTIIETNLSALYIMNYQADEALKILDTLEQQIKSSSCEEYSYLYHVEVNLLVVALLNGNTEKAKKYLIELEEIIPKLSQNSYFVKKYKFFSELCEKNMNIVYQEGFANLFNKELSSISSAWNFYGILPAFNTLEYWSET